MLTFLPERHYPNPPITEAVIDLTVQPEPGISIEGLEAIRDQTYPDKEPLIFNQVEFGAGTAKTTQVAVGWRFRRRDGLHIYQARLNGFGASRLAPYQNWETFSEEARRLWTRYRESARPVTVQRLGVRYINRIDIPLPLDDFGDYLLTAPLVSPHLPQGLSHYVMNLTIPVDELVTAVVTEAILNLNQDPPLQPKADTVSVLLDIDISQVLELSLSEEHIWQRFDYLRKIKNHVFESCITDRTRELFQ